MNKVLSLAKQYPLVTITLAVAALAGILTALLPRAAGPQSGFGRYAIPPLGNLVHWLIAAWAAYIVIRAGIDMIKTLRSGSFGVDILAITAITASILVGEFWAALVILLMLTGGEALEEYADGRAKQAMTSLVSSAPKEAHLQAADGSISEVPVEQVQVGDEVLVRAGEVVPVDGTLVSDAGVFDDSSLTGESIPKERVAGDEILSGSINGSTAVVIKATKAAAESQYQQIVALVEDAANSRSPMVRLADRFALPFTVIALAIGIFAWRHSGMPLRFAEVLVVATPCPLIIAAPVAFMSGMSLAARDGAIIRSSATLEKLRRAKAFAFDKTGTITLGEPTLEDIRPVGAFSADEILRLAAAAEQGSAHVLAAPIVKAATGRGSGAADGDAAAEAGAAMAADAAAEPAIKLPPATDVQEATGGGVDATVEGHNVAVGKVAYLEGITGVDVPEPQLEPGELAVHVAIDRQYAGYLVLRDQVRPDAAKTMASLRAQGIEEIAMFTGDEQATADVIANQVGIDEVHAKCLPADKVRGVQTMPRKPVVMVGDGVNDAPVLAAADVGIAIAARGSTAASESADVVILPNELYRVADTLRIGRHTVKIAMQSIGIGITASIILMLIAATGRLPAVGGAWLQELVDVIAILWALKAGGTAIFRRFHRGDKAAAATPVVAPA